MRRGTLMNPLRYSRLHGIPTRLSALIGRGDEHLSYAMALCALRSAQCLQRRDDLLRIARDLIFRKRPLARLEHHAQQQRVVACWHCLALRVAEDLHRPYAAQFEYP